MPGTVAGGVVSIPAGSTLVATVPVVLDNVICLNNHAMQAIPAGTIAGGVVTLELSLDGQNWFIPSSATITLATATIAGVAVVFPARFVRANITTVVSGSGGTVQVLVASA